MVTIQIVPTIKRWRLAALSILLLGTVAGCVEPASEPPVTAMPAPEARQETARAPETSAPEPEAPEIVAPKPSEIIGAPSAKLVASLGSASLVRSDIGAEIWQYRTDECVLFLFLYPKDTEMAVRHLESRGGPSAETCIRSVVKAKLSRKIS